MKAISIRWMSGIVSIISLLAWCAPAPAQTPRGAVGMSEWSVRHDPLTGAIRERRLIRRLRFDRDGRVLERSIYDPADSTDVERIVERMHPEGSADTVITWWRGSLSSIRIITRQ